MEKDAPSLAAYFALGLKTRQQVADECGITVLVGDDEHVAEVDSSHRHADAVARGVVLERRRFDEDTTASGSEKQGGGDGHGRKGTNSHE